MTPPGLTRYERAAVEKVLRAAGWRPLVNDGPTLWGLGLGDRIQTLDLRDVFPTPFTAQEMACTCHVTLVKGGRREVWETCPVHGEAS